MHSSFCFGIRSYRRGIRLKIHNIRFVYDSVALVFHADMNAEKERKRENRKQINETQKKTPSKRKRANNTHKQAAEQRPPMENGRNKRKKE